jgi:hypothetical protein
VTINPALMEMAKYKVAKDLGLEKVAVVPAQGGAPPMDPAMAGGAPPMDPAMAGGAPPMDPAMAGGAPPMDPAMAGGAMPPAPGMPPGMPPGAPPPMAPMDPMAAAGAAPAPKKKPEELMMMLDFRLYNMQQQLTAIMNALGVDLPPGALVTPPGSTTPVAEAAVPGGPQDPTKGMGAGGGGNSAISPIEPMQGASPELAQGGGGGEKMGAYKTASDFSRSLLETIDEDENQIGTPFDIFQNHSTSSNAAAVAAMLRRQTSS